MKFCSGESLDSSLEHAMDYARAKAGQSDYKQFGSHTTVHLHVALDLVSPPQFCPRFSQCTAEWAAGTLSQIGKKKGCCFGTTQWRL